MATIGKITVDLVARTNRFSKGMRTAQRRLGDFARSARQLGTELTMIGAAILAPIGLAIRNFTRYGDTVAKMARRTGVSTESIARLGYMAEISGGSIEGLEKGLKRMAKAITDGTAGMTTYTRAFGIVGLKAEELAQKKPENAFMKIGGAIGALKDPLKRMAAVYDIFGGRQMQLLPLFDLGSEGMRKLAERAEKLGIVLGTKTVRNAEKLQDAWTDLKKGAIGLSITVSEGLGIPFDSLSDKITSITERSRKWVKQNRDLIQNILKVGLAVVALGAGFLALAAAAKVAAFILSPLGMLGAAAAGILMLLDATGKVNTGWVDFVGNIRIGAHSIGTWFAAMSLGVAKVWQTTLADMESGWDFLVSECQQGMIQLAGGWDAFKIGFKEAFGAGATAEELEAFAERRRNNQQSMFNIQQANLKKNAALYADLEERVKKYTDGMQFLFAEDFAGIHAESIDDLKKKYTGLADVLANMFKIPAFDMKALKELMRPAALERGTVAAYSATVSPTYKAMNRNMQDTAKNTGAANQLLRIINQTLEEGLTGVAEVVTIGD